MNISYSFPYRDYACLIEGSGSIWKNTSITHSKNGSSLELEQQSLPDQSRAEMAAKRVILAHEKKAGIPLF